MTLDPNNQNVDIDLTAKWIAGFCPLIDGIIFPDGRVRQMFVGWVRGETERFELAVKLEGWTTLENLAASNQLEWTDIIPVTEARDAARDLLAVAGEGGHGSIGFVALTRASDGQIIWIAFFTTSNPFEIVELRSDHVAGKINLGTWWRFPLEAPYLVTLEHEQTERE